MEELSAAEQKSRIIKKKSRIPRLFRLTRFEV
jgi:hypothetical protein